MVKHTQIIRRQQPTNCLSLFDHFVKLALKGLENLLLEDLKNTAFIFKFDELTTQQVKKQYYGYVQYWSKCYNCIKMVYCGTIMVDICPSKKLLEYFLEFVNSVRLELKLMLQNGMNGPSVNLKFEDLLKSSPQMKCLDTTILSIGTFPLHVVHNAFRACINALKFSIDSFVTDVDFFLKLPAARRADYKHMQEFTEVIFHFIQKHSSSRWVTLWRICVQVSEQHQKLEQYFLKLLPKISTFKSTVRDTERYKTIKEVLENETSVPYIAFIAFVANHFEILLKIFQ